MLFAFPYALLGAATLAACAAVYFYRSRLRRKPVPSLMLWRRSALPKDGGLRRDTPRFPLVFFLELAALAALVAAAASPFVRRETQAPLAVIIDDSLPMSAIGKDGRTALERAERAAKNTGRRTRIRRAPAAVALSTLRHGEEALVISDRAPPDSAAIAAPVKWLAFGEPAPNAGITFAARSRNPDGTESVLIEVRAFAHSPASSPPRNIALGAPPLFAEELVALDADGRGRLRKTVPANSPDAIASIPADALAADNRAPLPSAARPVSAAVRIADPTLARAVRRAAEASGANLSTNAAADIVFCDSAAEQNWQTASRRIVFHAPLAPRLSSGPYLPDRASPLLEGVSFEGIAWTIGTNSLAGRALVFAGDSPIVALEKTRRSQTLRILASDASSPFFRSPSWPALAWNLVSECETAKHGPPPVWRFDPFDSDLRPCARGEWGGLSSPDDAPDAFRPLAWAAGLLAFALLALRLTLTGGRQQ